MLPAIKLRCYLELKSSSYRCHLRATHLIECPVCHVIESFSKAVDLEGHVAPGDADLESLEIYPVAVRCYLAI
jgi:hypothetical protein